MELQKLKLVESKQFCTRGVHVQHSKAECYHTGASKFTDTIFLAVYGMYMELSLFSTYPLLSAYYLTIYIYRRVCLTTGVYGIYIVNRCWRTCMYMYHYRNNTQESLWNRKSLWNKIACGTGRLHVGLYLVLFIVLHDTSLHAAHAHFWVSYEINEKH